MLNLHAYMHLQIRHILETEVMSYSYQSSLWLQLLKLFQFLLYEAQYHKVVYYTKKLNLLHAGNLYDRARFLRFAHCMKCCPILYQLCVGNVRKYHLLENRTCRKSQFWSSSIPYNVMSIIHTQLYCKILVTCCATYINFYCTISAHTVMDKTCLLTF